MTICIGSTNPVKVAAVKNAAAHVFGKSVSIQSRSVGSGVSEQPRSSDETKQGAENRARSALSQVSSGSEGLKDEVKLGIGLEGGVALDSAGVLWSFVWVHVVDGQGSAISVKGSQFPVPEPFAAKIIAGGEMGPVTDEVLGTTNNKHKEGLVGVLSGGATDRQTEFQHLVVLALGLWKERNLPLFE
ncbi:MAG: DUF84 family protein [Pseudomonadales bacterium]|nr:DUF84 family protein [Candidatus Woesebacteria bacterium]MCB9801527.1 DUF84 family protein [Pseudomonadales bacterium]